MSFRLINSTYSFLYKLIAIGLPAGIASVAKYDGIDTARQLDDTSIKDTLKQNFSKLSGIVNMASFAEALMSHFSVVIKTWPYLSSKQRISILFSSLLSASAAGYSFAVFGKEQNTMTAGGAASLSCFGLMSTQWLAARFATNNLKTKHATELLDDRSATEVRKDFRPF